MNIRGLLSNHIRYGVLALGEGPIKWNKKIEFDYITLI